MLLIIESSAKWPSVCIANIQGEVIYHQRADIEKSHAEKLPIFIENGFHFLKENNLKLEGVAINQGPGSYTGLRIGLSLAKGLCFGLNIPLIAIPGLEGMIDAARCEFGFDKNICSMLDARRDEVYAQVYLKNGTLGKTEAICLQPEVWKELIPSETIFIGDACKKAQQLLNWEPLACMEGPEVIQFAKMAASKFQNADFESVAYFEPFYMKEFEPGISKKFSL